MRRGLSQHRSSFASLALVGTIGGIAIAFWLVRLNEIPLLSADSLALAATVSVGYVLILLAAAVSLEVAGLLLGRLMPPLQPLLSRSILFVQVAFAALICFLLGGAFFQGGALALLVPLDRSILYATAAGLAGCAALATAWAPRIRPRLALAVALAVALLLGAGARSAPQTTIRRQEPSTETAAALSTAELRQPAQRVMLVGFDGLDPDILTTLIGRGELPNFRKVVVGGTFGRADTLFPTYSPAVWTTIATGKMPQKHGILGFVSFALPGVSHAVQRIPLYSGCGRMFHGLRRLGISRLIPASSTMRRSTTVWDILSKAGLRVGVVNWWASWPAEPVNGIVVSDGLFYAGQGAQVAAAQELVYPHSALPDLADRVVRPSDLTPDKLRRFFEPSAESDRHHLIEKFARQVLASDLTHIDIAESLLKRSKYDFFAVYLRGIDVYSHLTGEFSALVGSNSGNSGLRRSYGRALEEYYRYADEQLGRLLALTDPGTAVLICSDHGFERQRDGRFRHDYAPRGTFILYGPSAAAGRIIRGTHVLDFGPTVLYLAGQPVARDMDGRVVTEALREDALARFPVRYVDSYESAPRRPRVPDSRIEPGLIEQLRALGYLE